MPPDSLPPMRRLAPGRGIRSTRRPVWRHHGRREGPMGRIVYAAAMSHVLYPDYYGQNVGPHGRRMVEELMGVVREMGRTLATAAPDALVVIADDHLNVFSFDAIP